MSKTKVRAFIIIGILIIPGIMIFLFFLNRKKIATVEKIDRPDSEYLSLLKASAFNDVIGDYKWVYDSSSHLIQANYRDSFDLIFFKAKKSRLNRLPKVISLVSKESDPNDLIMYSGFENEQAKFWFRNDSLMIVNSLEISCDPSQPEKLLEKDSIVIFRSDVKSLGFKFNDSDIFQGVLKSFDDTVTLELGLIQKGDLLYFVLILPRQNKIKLPENVLSLFLLK